MVGEGESFLIELRRHAGFRHRHTHGGGDALPERAGGSFHARRFAVFGVPGRSGTEPAEGGDIVFRQPETVKVQKGIEQHGTVPRGQHETVPVVKGRIFGIVLHNVVIERVSERSGAQRKAGMAGFRFFHCLRGKHADGVYGLLTNLHNFSFFSPRRV